MFDSLSSSLTAMLGKKKALSSSELALAVKELKLALLEADVALPIAKNFANRVGEKALAAEKSEALTSSEQLTKIVYEELTALLGSQPYSLLQDGLNVIMLAGLQGVGKTTMAAKLAHLWRNEGHRVLLVAADLQRPNAVSQLKINGEKAGVQVFAPEAGNGQGDPVEVARAGVEKARQDSFNIVLIDTAGRTSVDEHLMAELKRVQEAITPTRTVFVADAMMGQNALPVAQAFHDALHYDAFLLNKLDGDARGGAALSLRGALQTPIAYVGVGEKLEELEAFYPERMASRILDLGDVLTLIEKAEKSFDMKTAAEVARRAQQGKMTLDDFIRQLDQMSKLGSLGKIVGMLPGMKTVKAQLDELDPRVIERKKAIIYSMTKAERQDYTLIDRSRALRIAAGSGATLQEVEDLLNRFVYAQQAATALLQGRRQARRPRPGSE